MAYSSPRGRKPFERASKISHAEIINNQKVQDYLAGCSIPRAASGEVVAARAVAVPPPIDDRIRVVVAIDGGYTETPIRREFPSASIAFFTLGPLLFKLEDLEELDHSAFIAPEDLAKLKRIQRYTFVLPVRNVSRREKALRRTIRESLQEFFLESAHGDAPLIDALRWLLFRGWETGGGKAWTLPSCPNAGCGHGRIELTPGSANEQTCASCGGPVFLVDAMRLHERIDEEQGAAGILGYVMTAVEQIVLVHVIKTLWELKPETLSEVLFVKDGPLAFFGQVAPLSQPMRELAAFLATRAVGGSGPGGTRSLLNVVGLEKSGAFVEHAIQIEDCLPQNTALLLSTDYIYRFIVPGDPMTQDPYGKNTYWGGKLIYKASDRSLYVATVPTLGFNPTPAFADFPNLDVILGVVSKLRCSMYDNALIPIALVNKLVSLSEVPSARILETFAKDRMRP
jgi:hypothetical protein